MTYKDTLALAHQHARACRAACSKALSLLDDEPLVGPGDDAVGPVNVGDNVKPNQQRE